MDKYQAEGAYHQMSDTYLLTVLGIVTAVFLGILLFAPAKRTVEWNYKSHEPQNFVPDLHGEVGCRRS